LLALCAGAALWCFGCNAPAATALSERAAARDGTGAAVTKGPALAGEPLRDGGVDASSVTESSARPTPRGTNDAGTSPDASESPEPLLLHLDVEGGATPMRPVFEPRTRRYSVIVTERFDALRLTVALARGLTLSVDGSPVASDAPLDLPATPDTTTELLVSNTEGHSATYSLVVLPPDFPDLVVNVHEPGSSSDPIYVALKSEETDYLAKLDANAVPLFYRALERHGYDFKKHPGGELSYSTVETEAEGAVHTLLDADFAPVGTVQTEGLVNTDEHEFHVLPNGNYVLLSYERADRDMTAYGGEANQRVYDGVLQELTRDREVVFQWNSWDHVNYEDRLYGDYDYAHINSVFVEADGNWIVSSRGLSQVLKIERATGEVLWRFGGKSGEFEFLEDPFANLCGQHTVTRTPDGTVLLFDNGQHCWPENPERGEHTRVAEYELDEERRTARLVWSYHRKDAYTYSQGSAQRLSNGNTFIGWGLGPRSLLSEVDAAGNLVFDVSASDGLFATYRAHRFPD
jgi:hypothetical protein